MEEGYEEISSGGSKAEPVYFPAFPKEADSIMVNVMTIKDYISLNDKVDDYGFTLDRLINSGVKNGNSNVGVYAGSMSSYDVFAPLMDKIIEKYHSFGPNQKHESDMSVAKLKIAPLSDEESKYIISTRIRIARNLENFPLGAASSLAVRKMVEKTAIDAFNTFEGDLKGTYYPLDDMSDERQKELIDQHFLFKSGDKYLEAAGLNDDWPAGRGIFFNDAKTFLVWVNEEDELRLISMEQGADFLAVFERLAKASHFIERKMKFLYHPRLGYITSCPSNLGTGLRASVHAKLPNLAKNPTLLKELADRFHVQIRGQAGEHTSDDSAIFDISNKQRLGTTEVELVNVMYLAVKMIIQAEMQLQSAASK